MLRDIAQARSLERSKVLLRMSYPVATGIIFAAGPKVLKFVVGKIRAVMTPCAPRFSDEENQAILLLHAQCILLAADITIKARVSGDDCSLERSDRFGSFLIVGRPPKTASKSCRYLESASNRSISSVSFGEFISLADIIGPEA